MVTLLFMNKIKVLLNENLFIRYFSLHRKKKKKKGRRKRNKKIAV